MAKASSENQARSFTAKTVLLDEIKPYQGNSRKHSPAQVKQLAASLRNYGWTVPLLVTPENELVAGHGRLLAARQIHQDSGQIKDWPDTATVPVYSLANLTPAQIKAYRIADNRLAEMSEWDNVMLSQELQSLLADQLPIEMAGFLNEDLERLLANFPAPGGGRKRGANRADQQPVIAYSIVFSTAEQQDQWHAFLKKLKAKYPTAETIAERIINFLQDNPVG